MIRLTIFKKRDGRIVYAPDMMFRILSALFFIAVVGGIVINVAEHVSGKALIIPSLLAILSLCAVCYRESWTFDPVGRTVRSVFGIAWFVRTETIPYASIARLELNHFVRGSVPDYEDAASKVLKPNKRRNKAMVVFSLHLTDDSMRDIEIIPEKTSQGRTESAAQAIAAISGLPLSSDRPRDMDLNVGIRDI
ncbi:MAG: hypothetical protein WCS18_05635 [Sphaerochaetaceae bacterium]